MSDERAHLGANHDVTVINARVWDGVNPGYREDAFVAVRQGRITRLGAMSELRRDDSAAVLDAEGRWVIPGLIDCHVHLIYDRFGTLGAIDSLPLEFHTIVAARTARTLLSYGYTTVRDVGTRGAIAPAVRDAVRAGMVDGPRILAAGPVICGTAGLADSTPPWMTNSASLGMPVNGEAEVRKAVRTQVKLGVDVVKVGLTGAEASVYTTTEQTSFSPEELRVLVDEAKRFGKTVACHAQSYLSARMALDAGVTTIEHGTRMDDETVERLAAAEDAYLVPTLCTLYSVLELGTNPKQVSEMKENREVWIDSFERAHRAGVKIAAGSDLGNRYLQGEQAKELELMVRHGMSHEEALVSATRTAAQALHLGDRVGTLEEGKFGDLLVLEADPLADVTVLQRRATIHRVVQGGRVLVPGELAEEVSR
ncbi:MAG TPA: amidohydrolase family protein [Trueperaceae bacterium]|jgi:imidazolonepropionase-like amidohydrolase